MDVDETKVFKILDLDDIEKTFSAYQRQQVLRTMQSIISPCGSVASERAEGAVEWRVLGWDG